MQRQQPSDNSLNDVGYGQVLQGYGSSKLPSQLQRQWQLWFSQAAACEPVEMPAQMPVVPHAHAAAVRMLPTQVEVSEMNCHF